MDNFIASVQSQTIYLDGIDNPTSVLTIPFYYWYEKTVLSNILKVSFYKALEEFPILADRMKTKSDSRNVVVIDKSSLNMPDYTDSPCNVHFQTLKDANFDVSLLPVNYPLERMNRVPPGVAGHSMKLAEFHIIRMKDDSGMCIYANISHAIFDGTSYCAFMKRWTEISRYILTAHEKQDMHGVDISTQGFQFDRSILETDEHSECDAIDPVFRKLYKSTIVSRFVAWISPELRGRLLKLALASLNIHNYYYHLSGSAIEHLFRLIQPLVEPDISHISANDVLTALVTVLFAQAFHKAGSLSGETEILATIAVDIRPRVERLTNANYAGNAIVLKLATSPLDLLLKGYSPHSLVAVACNTRRAVDGMDKHYCSQMWNFVNSDPSGYISLVGRLARKPNTYMLTNHTRFGYYETDFGSGLPVLVRPAFLTSENFVVIMPGRPRLGSYELAITMSPKVAKGMMESEYWKCIY